MGEQQLVGETYTVSLAKGPDGAIQTQCVGEVQYGPDFFFGSLTLKTSGEHESYFASSDLDVRGAVTVTAGALNLRARRGSMGSFRGHVEAGVIDLDAVTVAGSVTAHVQLGDVVVGPAGVGEVALTWDQPCGYVCLPDGQFVDDSACFYNSSTCAGGNCTDGVAAAAAVVGSDANSSNVTGGIAFQERLCMSRVCASAQSVTLANGPAGVGVSMDLSAGEGSIYLYDPLDCVSAGTCPPARSNGFGFGPNGTLADDENATSPKTIQLSDSLQREFSLRMSGQGEFDDALYPISLLSFQAESAWLLTDRRVYYEMEPGLLSVFSGTLLAPDFHRFKGGLMPGFCPFRRAPSQNDLGQVSALIKTTAQQYNPSLTHLALKDSPSRLHQYIPAGNEDASGYVREPIEVSSSLIVAVVFSLLLAASISAPLTVAVLYYLMVEINGYVLRNKINMRRSQLAKRSNRRRKTDPTAGGAKGHPAGGKSGGENAGDGNDVSGEGTVLVPASEATVEDAPTLMWLGFFATINFSARFFYRDFLADSVYQYFHTQVKARPPKRGQHWMSVEEFKDGYFAFCALCSYRPVNLTPDLIFSKGGGFGIVRHDESGPQTDRITRIRPASEEELAKRRVLGPQATSLERFLHATYTATEFDYDSVAQAEFRIRYKRYCLGHSLSEDTVRPPQLVAMGHPITAGTVTYLRYDASHLPWYLTTFGVKHLGLFARNYLWPWLGAWPMTDVIIPVFGWALAGFALPLPIVAICFFSQHELSRYATPSQLYYTYESFFNGPRPVNLDLGSTYLHVANQVMLILVGVYYGIVFISLVHYCYEFFANAGAHTHTRQAQPAPPHGGLKALMHGAGRVGRLFGRLLHAVAIFIEHGAVVVCVISIFGYIGLVLTWMLLGAIINPYKFLQYATAAAGVTTVVLSKVHSLLAIRGAISAQIDKVVEAARARAVALLKNAVSGAGRSLAEKVEAM